MRILILFFGITLLAYCKKEKPTYVVTYHFESSADAYLVEIWDSTNKNDFSDSIYSPTWSKTVEYDYEDTWRCKITNRKSLPSHKKIMITFRDKTTQVSDTLYPSIEHFTRP